MTPAQMINKIKALEARVELLEKKPSKKKKSKPTLTAPKD